MVLAARIWRFPSEHNFRKRQMHAKHSDFDRTRQQPRMLCNHIPANKSKHIIPTTPKRPNIFSSIPALAAFHSFLLPGWWLVNSLVIEVPLLPDHSSQFKTTALLLWNLLSVAKCKFQTLKSYFFFWWLFLRALMLCQSLELITSFIGTSGQEQLCSIVVPKLFDWSDQIHLLVWAYHVR